MSLKSCFVTWSSGADATSTSSVIRLNRSSSVGATARLRMLKPRRANRPDTRASTPALFSTSTDSRWCRTGDRRCRSGGGHWTKSSPERRVGDDVVVALAGRHHREHLLRGVGAEVDDDRAVVDLVGLLDGRLDLLGRLDPHADAAHGLGPELVVGQVGREVHLGVALLVEHLLPLADHAEVGVVEDGDLHRDALGRGGDELLRRHLEAAVAVDGPHHRVGAADLGADGGRARRSPSCRGRRSSPRCRGG